MFEFYFWQSREISSEKCVRIRRAGNCVIWHFEAVFTLADIEIAGERRTNLKRLERTLLLC